MQELNNIDTLHIPEEIHLKHEPKTVNKNCNMDLAVEWLMEGKYVLVEDEYSTGLHLLSELKKKFFSKSMKEDFKKYRMQRSAFHFTSNNLLISVSKGEMLLNKAPYIGWLEVFYPENSEIYLSFPQMQGLNSSWQWYVKGIQYPVLSDRIHPFYGVYFPTRFDHLMLFESWIKQQRGVFGSAMDVGTGCGVLSFQLLKHGIESVLASDINPNAIHSVQKDRGRMEIEPSKLITVQSDLFKNIEGKSDLIVFNPPWLPAQKEEEGLDQAIYYKADLFDRFFSEAAGHLNENGRIVILFSNLALVEGYQVEHPVISELALQNRFKKSDLIKRKSAQKSKKTKRRDNRKNEYIELWVLRQNL